MLRRSYHYQKCYLITYYSTDKIHIQGDIYIIQLEGRNDDIKGKEEDRQPKDDVTMNPG